jgi:oligopeptide/dipeptide ABC transporter ATP-binding protein
VAAVLEVEGLTVEIRSVRHRMRPVEDVSFAVDQGQTMGVVGESGSGKSTMLLAILGTLPAEAHIVAGSIAVQGRDVVHLARRERQALRGSVIGMIFQDPASALNPVTRIGRQLVDGASRHLKLDRRQAKELARQLLVQVGVPDPDRRLRAYPHQLSGGLRQRVMIAMALASRPSILLCDEPTTALDVTIQNQVLNLIAEIQGREQLALVYVTHDLAVVRQICHRVAVMYAAHLVEVGTCDDVLGSPEHPYTRELLAAVPDITRPTVAIDPILGSPPNLWSPPSGCRFRPRCKTAKLSCATGAYPLLGDGDHRNACPCVGGGSGAAPAVATTHVTVESTRA